MATTVGLTIAPPAPAPARAAAPSAALAPEPTKAELVALLAARGVKAPSKATRARLLELVDETGGR